MLAIERLEYSILRQFGWEIDYSALKDNLKFNCSTSFKSSKMVKTVYISENLLRTRDDE